MCVSAASCCRVCVCVWWFGTLVLHDDFTCAHKHIFFIYMEKKKKKYYVRLCTFLQSTFHFYSSFACCYSIFCTAHCHHSRSMWWCECECRNTLTFNILKMHCNQIPNGTYTRTHMCFSSVMVLCIHIKFDLSVWCFCVDLFTMEFLAVHLNRISNKRAKIGNHRRSDAISPVRRSCGTITICSITQSAFYCKRWTTIGSHQNNMGNWCWKRDEAID